MNKNEQSLFDRISQFSFDDGDPELTFAGRLARDNRWTEAYTARVIDEYRRFAFLAVVAGHPVTPSDQVDQVWHLHLTYTKPYWDQFCGDVLKTPLHHGPTRGGPEEARKYKDWYRSTLASYIHFFGHEPPSDIWPDPSIRFGDDLYFQRVNLKRHWSIRKPELWRRSGKVAESILVFAVVAWLLVIGLLLAVAPFLQGRANLDKLWSQLSNRPWAVVIVVSVLLIVGVTAFAWKRCPECKRRRALQRTGSSKDGRDEWKCKYCGHCEWMHRDSGGCGGCGCGCGG